MGLHAPPHALAYFFLPCLECVALKSRGKLSLCVARCLLHTVVPHFSGPLFATLTHGPEKVWTSMPFLFCVPAFQFRVSGQRFRVQGSRVLGFRVKGLNMATVHAHLEAGATCTCTIGHQCPMHMHTWAPVCPLSCTLGPSSLCPCTPCMPAPHAPAHFAASYVRMDFTLC